MLRYVPYLNNFKLEIHRKIKQWILTVKTENQTAIQSFHARIDELCHLPHMYYYYSQRQALKSCEPQLTSPPNIFSEPQNATVSSNPTASVPSPPSPSSAGLQISATPSLLFPGLHHAQTTISSSNAFKAPGANHCMSISNSWTTDLRM